MRNIGGVTCRARRLDKLGYWLFVAAFRFVAPRTGASNRFRATARRGAARFVFAAFPLNFDFLGAPFLFRPALVIAAFLVAAVAVSPIR